MTNIYRFHQSNWHRALLIAGICTAIFSGINPIQETWPVALAQSAARASQIVTGELSTNSPKLEDGSYYETHTFEGTIGETLTFDLISNDFDAYLILMNPAGEQIAGDDDGAGGTNARITLRLPTTGTYTLIVNSYGVGKTGTYRLETRTATAEEQALAQVNQLNQQAVELYQAADFASAIPLVEQALEISEQELGPEHTFTALSLSNLASLYMGVGRYEEAESLLKQELAISEHVLGPEHPNVAASLSTLALVYRNTGRYEEAESLLKRGLAISEYAFGSDHPSTATSLNNLAELYRVTGRYREAEPLYNRALTISEQEFGPDHLNTVTSLNNLALLYQAMGRYEEAEPLFQEVLAIIEQKLGSDHPSTLTSFSLSNLALLYQAMGQPQTALTYLQRVLVVQGQALRRNLVGGSDATKRDYLATMAITLDQSMSLHLNDLPSDEEAAYLALTAMLQRKGRIVDFFTNLRAQLGNAPDSLRLLDDIQAASTQLANLTFNSSPDFVPEIYQIQRQALHTQIDNLEDQLSRRSIEFASLTASPSVSKIQAALPLDATLVEFIRYQPFDPTVSPQERLGDARYAAYILQSNGTIQGLDLGAAEVIDRAVVALSTSLASADTPIGQVKAEAKALEALVMAPVREALGSSTTVFLSPDGALNLIPFEALVYEENGSDKYLIEEFQFRYLTSGRDLIRLDGTAAGDNPALLIGNPTYGLPGELVAQPNTRTIDFEKRIFPALPGTQTEVSLIADKLVNTEVYTQTNATEAVIKEQAQPSILHVATHGFFEPVENSLNPLLQSGLILAGAAAGGQSGPDQDGILTALEVTGMNLSGTQLVVLSACETGLGEIAAGEGLYGLRRAFVLAGSQTQVISLWKVSDTATQELMVDYYDRLLSGTPRDAALRDTQLAFLESEDYSHPYYWAAFIGSGDWRPLQLGQ